MNAKFTQQSFFNASAITSPNNGFHTNYTQAGLHAQQQSNGFSIQHYNRGFLNSSKMGKSEYNSELINVKPVLYPTYNVPVLPLSKDGIMRFKQSEEVP
jgi:hypothetical protein